MTLQNAWMKSLLRKNATRLESGSKSPTSFVLPTRRTGLASSDRPVHVPVILLNVWGMNILRWLKYCSIEVYKVFASLIDDSTFAEYELFILSSHSSSNHGPRSEIHFPPSSLVYKLCILCTGIDRSTINWSCPRSIRNKFHSSIYPMVPITINTRSLVTGCFHM